MCFTEKCTHENAYGHCRKPKHKICPKAIIMSNGINIDYKDIKKDPVDRIHKQMELFSENLNKKYKGIK